MNALFNKQRPLMVVLRSVCPSVSTMIPSISLPHGVWEEEGLDLIPGIKEYDLCGLD